MSSRAVRMLATGLAATGLIVGGLFGGHVLAARQPAEKTVEMHAVNEQGVQGSIGVVVIRQEAGGLTLEPKLQGLGPGLHGFHVHQYADCGSNSPDGKRGPALAAGSHLDPEQSGKHGPPWAEDSHRGDLPALYVNEENRASQAVHLHGLKLQDLVGHALVIHAGGDNYADEPKPLGGGGERVACGTVEE